MAQDDDLERDALLRQLDKNKPSTGGGGVFEAPQDAPPAEAAPAAPAVNYGGEVGQYGSKLEGFDAGKLGSDHDSAKYQIGRTLSHFDPKGGVSGDALAALNGLGIGTFSGQGDKLHVAGGSHGLQGDTDLDVVRDLEHGGGWQYGVDADDVTRKGGGVSQGGSLGAAGPSSLATIQGLMPTDTDFYQKLQDSLAQQLGGYPSLDRNALLRMMGGQ
jgi:hypothetical protein